jgi:hypothetical protein
MEFIACRVLQTIALPFYKVVPGCVSRWACAALAQLVRALVCGTRGPPFNPGRRYQICDISSSTDRVVDFGVAALMRAISNISNNVLVVEPFGLVILWASGH